MEPTKMARFMSPTPEAEKFQGGENRYVAWVDTRTAKQTDNVPNVMAGYAMAGNLNSGMSGL